MVAGHEIDADPIEIERKRLRFRSWHRGTREADLLLGRFADAHLDALDAEGLRGFAALLERADPDIFDWLTGRCPVPRELDNEVFGLLRRFEVQR